MDIIMYFFYFFLFYQFHHCNKRFYDIDDEEIDYRELLVNYYNIILRKEYNRILPPTISDFSIIDWQIAMGKFQQFWRKTRDWSLDNVFIYYLLIIDSIFNKMSSNSIKKDFWAYF